MGQSFLQLDRKIFFLINGRWHTGWLDALLPFTRNPYFWAPLYLFLLLFMVINFKRKGVWWVVFFILTFGVTDFITGNIIKDLTVRMRPCNDPYLSQFTRSLVPCSGHHCFPSNHASNHTALALFIFMTLKDYLGKWTWVIFLWAFTVCYAQMYVGQHYPSDILAGILIGLFFGSITSAIFNRKIGLSLS